MSAASVVMAVPVSMAVPMVVAAAAQAERELRLVEIGFVLLLAGCATGALVLLGVWGRKER
ncbi:hypothetical protein [Streptomyces sp. CBMA123]|uniref:hypothetical protein n=1 Tax=Streptomyces sp. CBMA123 TaxID=1896313 RepID=UPI0016618E51|nr:hypothetical protein [Streptomyces sp. CBMA123]